MAISLTELNLHPSAASPPSANYGTSIIQQCPKTPADTSYFEAYDDITIDALFPADLLADLRRGGILHDLLFVAKSRWVSRLLQAEIYSKKKKHNCASQLHMDLAAFSPSSPSHFHSLRRPSPSSPLASPPDRPSPLSNSSSPPASSRFPALNPENTRTHNNPIDPENRTSTQPSSSPPPYPQSGDQPSDSDSDDAFDLGDDEFDEEHHDDLPHSNADPTPPSHASPSAAANPSQRSGSLLISKERQIHPLPSSPLSSPSPLSSSPPLSNSSPSLPSAGCCSLAAVAHSDSLTGETRLLFSDYVLMVSRRGRLLPRLCVITSNAVYFMVPSPSGSIRSFRRTRCVWIDSITTVSVPPQHGRFFVLHSQQPAHQRGAWPDRIIFSERKFTILYIISSVVLARRCSPLRAVVSNSIPIRSSHRNHLSEVRFRSIPPTNSPPKLYHQLSTSHPRQEVTFHFHPESPAPSSSSTAKAQPTASFFGFSF